MFFTITIDATAPNAPSIVTFSPDTSIVGDSITSANQLTLTGTAAAGSKVLVFDGATQVGTATVDAGGNWSFATGTLVDGTHPFTGQAVDAAGNVSLTSGALNVAVDTVAPNAPTIVSDTLAASNKVVVSGTAEAGTTIKLYEGNTLLGTAVTAANGAWSVTTGSLAAGTHAFTATSTDAAGNSSGLSAAFDPVVGTLIEAAGATSLVQVGSNYLLDPTSSGSGPTLKYNGAAYVTGQFSNWTPIAAEATSSGYDVAWKITSTGVYTVWAADSNGNFTSNLLSNVSGTNAAFESIETLFHQDLNGDGVIGLRTTTIEAAGATSLVQAGSNYLLNPAASGNGPTLKYNGAACVAGQFSGWTPIAAEATSSGYDVAWKNTSTGVYTVWTADNNGNFTSKLLSNVSGTSAAFESIETLFQQDLNGDGVIGLRTMIIEASGTTNLVQAGTNFLLNPAAGGSGPTLKYNGAAYVTGQFSNWTPIAAEATSSGYDVAWKNTSTGVYTVWAADSNGNFTSNLLSNVSGTSAAFESIETLFHQDLNGDGVIGLRTTTIEAAGATSLVQAGSNYLLNPAASGNGPTLKYNGAACVAGQFSGWTPIAAEATSSGYDVAWKNTSTGVYTVWTADNNGNFTSKLLSNVSGTSAAFESIETLFQQDLNGDGVIGLRTTIIEASGTTNLVQAGTNFLLNPAAGGSGPTLKYNGAAYVTGQFSNWTPIAAEGTSSGYDVAWKNTSTGVYTVWTADSNGNFTSNLLSNVSGTSTSLKSIEVAFHQDLNGDGAINTSSTVLDISGKIVLTLPNLSQPVTLEPGAVLELTGAASGSVTFKGVTGTLVLDHSTQFAGTIYSLSGNGDPSSSDILDLKDILFGSGTKVAYSGDTSGGILTVADAQNHAAQIKLVGDYTHSTFNLSSDGSAGTLVIDPPVDQFNFSFSRASTPPATPIHAAGVAGDAFLLAGTAAAGPAEPLISTDHARDRAPLIANHIGVNFDHALEQGAPHIEITSHIDPTDLHGYLLRV
ncbi:Ig-like domain-containing protein [Bradyrhizobium sp. RDM4]|uniref:Ig-like domain-containing protein n=1 Tax=Bradyrhizobium sp. RDM4 TaxID=3378765 RepID=UPI0038FC1070